jgi:hypothetical protein
MNNLSRGAGNTNLPNASVVSQRTANLFNTQFQRFQVQQTNLYGQLNYRFFRDVNNFGNRFSNFGQPFTATTSDFYTSLNDRFNSLNDGFRTLSGLQTTQFTNGFSAFNDLGRTFDPTTGSIETLRSNFNNFRTTFANDARLNRSAFDTTTVDSRTAYNQSLGSINNRFNSSFNSAFGYNPFNQSGNLFPGAPVVTKGPGRS